MADSLAAERELARQCAHETGDLVMRFFRQKSLAVEMKADDTPVSAADRAAEAFIRPLIRAAFPDDAIHGEEEAPTPGTSGRTWHIDPIDGTKAFIKGLPYFGVLIGLAEGSTPIVGAVSAPALAGAPLWSGARGTGADLDGEAISVSTTTSINDAYYVVAPPALAAGAKHSGLLEILNNGYHRAGFLDVLAYVDLAMGGHDFVISKGEKPFDICAPGAIIEAAGGRCTSVSGGSCLISEDILASNGALHDDLQKRLVGYP